MSIFVVIFSLLFLIVLHELGHFLFAKKYGVRVDEFGIGIPPRIFGKKIGETLYSFNMLPLGGFVKLYGEDKEEEGERSFSQKPIYQRALIIFAGVAAFFIISAVIFSAVSFIGVRSVVSDDIGPEWRNEQIMIVEVSSLSPAEEAGIVRGDILNKINDEKVSLMSEVTSSLLEKKGEEVQISVLRGEEEIIFSLVPRIEYAEGEGAVGVGMVRTAERKFPLHMAPIQGVMMTGEMSLAVVSGFYTMISSFITRTPLPPGMEVGGPVKIVEMGASSLERGFVDYLYFIGVISVSLAVLNILPIPALDGGRLLFLGVEKIKGGAISRKLEQGLNTVFFLILITLMIFITFKDIQGLL